MKRPGRATLIAAIVGLLVAFWLGDRLTQAGREQLAGASGLELMNRLGGLAGKILDTLKQPFALSLNSVDLIGGAVLAGLIGLIALYQLTSKTNRRHGQEQGSASWSSPRDIAPLTDSNPAHRIQLTATEALSTDTRKTRRNLNVMVLGGSGTGKTRSYLMPNLAQVDMSTAITDPKGEILREVGPALRERGMAVRVFNLVDPRNSDHFNPFRYFDDDDPETSIVQLVECIMANTSGAESSGSNEFWDRAERALLTALAAFVWATVEETPTHEPSLIDVVDLHKEMSAMEGEGADNYRSDVDLKFEAAREVVAQWRSNPPPQPDPAEEKVIDVLDFACRQYRVFEQGAGETKKSIIISMGVRLAPLDMNAIRKIIADDTVNLDQLGYEPCAIFLEIPDTHQTFRFLATMFWQSIFSRNVYLADHSESGRLPRQVHFFLDEFANIGKIPQFAELIATIRSRGMSASIIMQAYSQGKSMWKDDWPTLIGNCDSLLYLGGRDSETHKWISEQAGEETVVSQETSRTYGAQGSYTRSDHKVKRALMTPDEVGRLPDDECLLFVRGLRPFKSRKAKAGTWVKVGA